ncbi:interferon-induced very large GTPase 1-like [Rhinoderma darwinii]|uniref:interferon-induced very large GTPase 1-like n=1 Tax=Rhinoderma darwinii TaxID=43563 RepID=UPI003F674229
MAENPQVEERDGDSPEGSTSKDLTKRLEDVGLNPQKWTQLFRKHLGVESRQSLAHMGPEDYLKIEKHAEFPWEKEALRKLLNIHHPSASLTETRDEQVKKTIDKEIKGKTRLDEAKKVKLEAKQSLQKKLEIEAQAMKTAKDMTPRSSRPVAESLEAMMDKYDQGLTEKRPLSHDGLSDQEVLLHASGGLALEGIYLTMNPEDVLQKRDQLLAVPSGFCLTGPQQKPVLEQKEFSSSEEETTFHKSMEKLGFSVATAAKGGFWCIQAEASAVYNSTSVTKQKQDTHNEHAYISTTKYCYIPLASSYMTKDQLRLSSAALQELSSIEDLLKLCSEVETRNILREKYGRFFSRFGSHANRGPLHFGGIFWWTATSKGFKQEMLKEVQEETQKVLDSSVNISCSCGWSFSVSNDITKTDTKQSMKTDHTKKNQKDIQLTVTKTGGPLTVDSLSEWKSGLDANNKTWSVIDRGLHLTPVWEILLCGHKEEFRDVYKVAKDLKNVYLAITGQHSSLPVAENVSTAAYHTKLFLSKLSCWPVDPAQQQLQILIDFRQQLNDKTGNYNIWLNLCLPHEALHSFLHKVMESYKQNPKADEPVIRSLLKCLLQNLEFASENLDSYSAIITWLHPEKKEEHVYNMSDFPTFIKSVSTAKNDLLQLSRDDDPKEGDLDAKVKINVLINSYIGSFLKNLRTMGQKEEEMIVLCAASSVGYSAHNHYFQQRLGFHEVNFMVDEMQRLFKEYNSLKDIGVCRAQAFLLEAALTAGDETRPRSTEQKRELVQLILDDLKSGLEQEIVNVLQKHKDLSDLPSLIEDFKHLRSGDCQAMNVESFAEEIKNVCHVTNHTATTGSLLTGRVENNPTTLKQDVLHLISRLGLKQHFPKGLTRRNFHVVYTSLLKCPDSESELPLYFMQMLMKLDYRFRYLIYKGSNKINSSDNASCPELEADTFDSIDDLLNLCSEEEVQTVSEAKETIHPMDLLMAVYHCSDDFMRQYTFTKLSICQFALPFLVPRPYDSEIELPLWAFRQVQKSVLDFQLSETGTLKEKLICQVHVPVISFTRVGSHEFSKSQLLTNLLSKHKHNIFYHRNCEGSIKNRVLINGMAEIFWFCPTGKDTDQFSQSLAFVNLRGDIQEHKKQSQFLQEISSINVIVYSRSTSSSVMSMKNLKGKPLIILSPEREASVNVDTKRLEVIIGLKNRNEAKVLEELTTSIRRLLAASPKSCSLETCAKIGKQCGFYVDEDCKECVDGKAEAEKMMGLLKRNDLMTAKEELLPLSGSLWRSWCEKDRELNCLENKMNRRIDDYRSQTEKDKNSIRKKQLKKASQNQFMKDFIALQTSLSKPTKRFFLQWFKIFIDDLSCDLVSELRNKYTSVWTRLQSGQLANKELVRTLQGDLDSLSTQMNASLFGLEHILREVGQTYEALHDLQNKDECFDKLPKIAADMMVYDGYPIELMDGDACYVPVNWIKAVLTEVIKTIGDKKMFVLSVLGVQSSGKSTLLNTMFGLQFGVSAGRCTRGAFMQLMEIADELKKELGFDYILVIDTEGLRAMELANQSSMNHDNELATFVIGVGNMTLINVFGENPSEIKDILQIAVQAFLRMKQVKLSTSCLFVHQNVGELTAHDKNAEGRRLLQTELDKMTALAAEQEMCHVQRFSDVIKFDANRHIYYFSHLWDGNPPMAPPNPLYSENTQTVKDLILRSRNGDSGGILSISQVSVRIEDLWTALKNENFVFSFKNTLEISAYKKVENKYRKLTWQLRRHFLELQARLNNKIKKGDIITVSHSSIESEAKEMFESIKDEFEDFFSEEKDKEILIQWKANVLNRLTSLSGELVEETKRKAAERVQLKKSQNHVNQRQLGYEEQLRRKSMQLALDLKDKGLEESQLKDHFIALWQRWVTEISNSSPKPEEPQIISDAEDVLFQYYREECTKSKKLSNFSRWSTFSVDLSKHAAGRAGIRNLFHILGDPEKRSIEQVFLNLKQIITKYLEDKQREKVDYTKAFFYQLLQDVSEIINEKKFDKFTLKKMFNFHVSLYFCGLAVPIFQSMHEAFRHTNDPVVILESKREEFFNCFKISCEGAASIKTTFADFLCKKTLEAIRPALYERTGMAIVDEMTSNYPPFASNRSRLEAHILIYLAEREDFEKYRQYLHFPKTFFRDFIETSVNDFYLDEQSHRLKDTLHISLDHFHKLVLLSIAKSTRIVKDKNGKVSEWLDDFYKRIGDHVTFTRADLKSIEHQEIQDIEFIQEVMCASWNEAVENFKKDFDTTTFDSFETKPHEILVKQLCGCWEQCPFCGAICTHTIDNHDGDHSVPFHRPQAITGISWIDSNEFVIDICSNLVSSNNCLVISPSKQILYRNYRTIGPNYANWSITADNSSPPYWKWFVAQFRSKLEEDYNLKFRKEDIPAEWSHINKDEMIAKLRDQL